MAHGKMCEVEVKGIAAEKNQPLKAEPRFFAYCKVDGVEAMGLLDGGAVGWAGNRGGSPQGKHCRSEQKIQWSEQVIH